MNKKNITKIILDIVMAVLFITFFNKNLISIKFHMISGVVFVIFILVHMILNRKWIYNISMRLFDKKINFRTKLSYIISLILFVLIILILFSGVYIIKEKTYDRVMFWKMVHFGASYLSIALIGIHIGLYWKWIMNIFKKAFKIKSSSVTKLISLLIVLATLAFGFYTIYNKNYFTKTYLCIEYVVQYIVPQDLEVISSYYNESKKTSFIEIASTYGSITSVFSILTYYSDKVFRKSKNHDIKNNKISA